MNQQCKVCGEPAAGFHFGAFTCEGCKSFFGRSYNNLSSITECKNNGECVINKKNRTACKACRLRKCLLVGMSKSGSRYGRRSNWFKIHCLLQEQQQQQQAAGKNPSTPPLLFPHPMGGFLRPETAPSPSISSPDSDCSDSPRLKCPPPNPFLNKDFYLSLPFPSFPFIQPPSIPSPFLLPPTLFPYPPTPHDTDDRTASPPELLPPHPPPPPIFINNNYDTKNNNVEVDKTSRSKRFYLDAILGLQPSREGSPKPEERCDRSIADERARTIQQDDPIDLSVKRVVREVQRTPELVLEGQDSVSDRKNTSSSYAEEGKPPIPLDLSV